MSRAVRAVRIVRDGMPTTAHLEEGAVVLDDGTATSSTQSAGRFSHQFATAGTYTSHCAVHGSSMSGKVVVQ